MARSVIEQAREMFHWKRRRTEGVCCISGCACDSVLVLGSSEEICWRHWREACAAFEIRQAERRQARTLYARLYGTGIL